MDYQDTPTTDEWLPHIDRAARIQELKDTNAQLLIALEAMLDLFDHTGIFGLIAGAPRNSGWTEDHLNARINACKRAKAVLAKAKGARLYT